MLAAILAIVPTEHYITTGGQIIIAIITTVGVVLAARGEVGNYNARKARQAAELAAKRSAPTGNGYASRTEAALERIETRLERLEDRLDSHIDRKA